MTSSGGPMATERSRSQAGPPGHERGSMSISALIGLAFLVIPSLMLVLAVPPWEASTADARDAARTAVLALASNPDWSAATLIAYQAVDDAGSEYGLSLSASLGCNGSSTSCNLLCLPGGTTVTASVKVTVPVGNIPGVIDHYASVGFTATYTGTMDQYAADNGCN